MDLHQAQKTIVTDNHRFRVILCGRRFGKTTLAVLEMIGKAVFKSNRNIAYIAPTFQQARDIAWQEMKKIVRPATNDINESRLEITLNTTDRGTSTIKLRSWDAIDTLRGQHFDFIVLDEVASMRNFWEGWEEVLRPCLADTKGECMFIGTPKGFNHFYDLYNKERLDTDYKSFHFTTYDNPFIPSEEIDKARLEMPEDRFAQEYMADFRKQEGLVYKEFMRDKHLYNELPAHAKVGYKDIISGIDWGFTNPCAVTKIYVDSDNHFWIDEEYYKTGQTKDQIIEIAKGFQARMYYPDPEDPEAIEKAKKWLNVREVNKSIKNGIDHVRELFKQGRIHINRNCVHLIEEIEQYAYPEKRDLHNFDENPIKENDHLMDSMRYALFNYQPSVAQVSSFKPKPQVRSFNYSNLVRVQ